MAERYEKSYKAVLDAIFCRILIFDRDGRLVHFNHAAVKMFMEMDIDLENEVNTHFDLFADKLEKETDFVNSSGRYCIEIKGQRIICNVYPWTIEKERLGSVIIMHEAMHEHCSEQVLNKNISLLQEIDYFLESSHDGLFVTDRSGVIIRVNTAFEKALSIERKSVIGKNVSEIVAAGIYPESAALQVIKTGKPSTVMISKDGKNIIATGTPVRNECGEFVSVVVNVRDITELNNLTKQLEHQKAVAEGYFRKLSYMKQLGGGDVIANSKEMQKIMDTVKILSQVDSTILITGESGTGKEVIANQIYKNSNRMDKPFLKINCGAIPETLFESELFGYEDGAFTGASKKGKAGLFELADNGTLFMDEIGELDMNLQVKLLRVIQEGEVTRVGGTKAKHVDVRLITATNRDLWQQVQDGKFRQDLYYRLNVVNIEIPPLRERRDDIIPLAYYFIEKFNKKYKKEKALSLELGRLLKKFDWPGNIRELENLVENMVVLSQNDVLLPEDMPLRYQNQQPGMEDGQVFVQGVLPLNEAVAMLEKQLLRNAQQKYSGTREIAKALGVNQSTISRKINKLL